MYFLMAALDKSYVVPMTVMLTVPLCLIGVLPVLYLTGTAINVQSLLGVIFIVGIKVANTVLMTDYAQELRRHEGLDADRGDPQGGLVRVRPVTMTALAAFFAMVPMALALGRGSEANAPLGPRDPGRLARRRARHPLRPARALFADGPRPETTAPATIAPEPEPSMKGVIERASVAGTIRETGKLSAVGVMS